MSDNREAFERIDRLFVSGSSIPVERVTITKEMWDGVKAWQASREAVEGEPVAWSWLNRGRQVTVDKAFAGELIEDGEVVHPLYTHPASADIREHQRKSYHKGQTELMEQFCEVVNGLLDGDFSERSGLLDPWKSTHDRLRDSLASADNTKDHAVIQAKIWAQEARTQKAIVMEIGELVGCANDWEMVGAVRMALDHEQAASVPELTSEIINDCCWLFVEKMPHNLPAPIFNDLKPALHEAIKKYHHWLASIPENLGQAISDWLAEHGDVDWCDSENVDALIREAILPNVANEQAVSVPEGWRKSLAEMVDAMREYQMSVDEEPPYKHKAMMQRALSLLAYVSQPPKQEDK